MSGNVTVVCLCGPMYGERNAANLKKMQYIEDFLSRKGITVLVPVKLNNEPINEKTAYNLHKAFDRKIDMCDILYVVNSNNRIGNDTMREIKYAMSIDKPVYVMCESDNKLETHGIVDVNALYELKLKTKL